MGSIRYKISTIFLITFLVAIACTSLVPFSPKTHFTLAFMREPNDAGDADWLMAVIKMTNTGSTSVWYQGESDSISSFAYQIRPDCEDTGIVGWQGTHATPIYWSELSIGKATYLRIPVDKTCEGVLINVKVTDWRNRTADATSEWVPIPALDP